MLLINRSLNVLIYLKTLFAILTKAQQCFCTQIANQTAFSISWSNNQNEIITYSHKSRTFHICRWRV